jgi:holo-[acyl-carrier protein] synthase
MNDPGSNVRIGVDLLTISRFLKIADHPRYRSLIFTGPELDQAGQPGTGRFAERLAGRFAVKEATCKVLGRGFGQGVRWRDIEVTSDGWGAPRVTLSGGAAAVAAAAGLAGLSASITHQSDLVVAVVTAALQPGSGDGHDHAE